MIQGESRLFAAQGHDTTLHPTARERNDESGLTGRRARTFDVDDNHLWVWYAYPI